MELHIGENIKRLRKDRSMTQEQLAEAMGVTVGAVYKWENGLSMPEIRLVVELADLFEISVDYLLGYEMGERGVEAAVERLDRLLVERKFTEGAREAEKLLQKYPNNFDVVFMSAQFYYIQSWQDEKAARRCIELFERTCLLFEQNKNEKVTLANIKEAIATCYIGLKQYDKTIELLKKLNADDSKNDMIGMVLAQFCNQPEEALPYLTAGIYGNLLPLMRSVIGFYKSYTQLDRCDDALAVIQWALNAMKGLKDPSTVSFLDKMEAVLLALLADVSLRKGNVADAKRYFCAARDIARRFDAAPEYRTFVGLNFYHCSEENVSLDDMGDTAMLAIENYLGLDACEASTNLWEEIKNEEE